MPTFQVSKDFETSERAGAGGMFQIERLLDANGQDITHNIDVGIHFNNDEELIDYLAQIFGLNISQIDIIDI